MDLIDRASRTLVDHPVPSALRANVMSRIDERRAHPWRWPLAAAAMTTLGVIAWLVALPDARRPLLPSVAAPPLVSAGIRLPAPPADLRIDADVEPRVARDATVSEAERAWRARTIPALEAPRPLEVAVTQPDAVIVPPLTVTPLAPSRVVVPPLDPGSWGRDRR